MRILVISLLFYVFCLSALTEAKAQSTVVQICQVDVYLGYYYNCHPNVSYTDTYVGSSFWNPYPQIGYGDWGYQRGYNQYNSLSGWNNQYNNRYWNNNRYANKWARLSSGIGIRLNINLNHSNKPKNTIWLDSCRCYVPIQ